MGTDPLEYKENEQLQALCAGIVGIAQVMQRLGVQFPWGEGTHKAW